MSTCDRVLSEFCEQTGADAAFARDLLEGNKWNLLEAVKTYNTLCQPDGRKSAPPKDAGEISIGSESSEDSSEGRSCKLSRGFSKATENDRLIVNARQHLAKGIAQTSAISAKESSNCFFIETPSYTFTLPDLTEFSDEFRKFLEKDLIETATLRSLEESGQLNWWASASTSSATGSTCQKLLPLATTGDGNCLLHAASLGMWGFHDRLLILRKALHLILTKGSRKHALWRRWRWQQTYQNKQSGLIYSEKEWRAEWDNLVRLASPQPRSTQNSSEPLVASNAGGGPPIGVEGAVSNLSSPTDEAPASNSGGVQPLHDTDSLDVLYESLEEVHVFALAHVLKRPIVVVADTVLRDARGDAFAPIPFSGIYLPLECPPNECHRSPLVLCYDAAHFSALVAMQQQPKRAVRASADNGCASLPPVAIIPITDAKRRLLPLHFECDPGADFSWWLEPADEKIAARTFLTDVERIHLICKYVDVIREPLKTKMNGGKASTLPFGATPWAAGLASRVGGSHSSVLAVSASPRHVAFDPPPDTAALASTDAGRSPTTTKTKKALGLRSIGKFLRRKFRHNVWWNGIRRGRSARSSTRGESASVSGVKSAQSTPRHRGSCSTLISPPPPMLDEVCDPAFVVGARLFTETHHQFMDEMIKNYLQSAKQRFDADASSTTATAAGVVRQQRRDRISRSISVANMALKCMNGACTREADHAKNYLCDECFLTQKSMMETFCTAAAVQQQKSAANRLAETASADVNGNIVGGVPTFRPPIAPKPVIPPAVGPRLAPLDEPVPVRATALHVPPRRAGADEGRVASSLDSSLAKRQPGGDAIKPMSWSGDALTRPLVGGIHRGCISPATNGNAGGDEDEFVTSLARGELTFARERPWREHEYEEKPLFDYIDDEENLKNRNSLPISAGRQPHKMKVVVAGVDSFGRSAEAGQRRCKNPNCEHYCEMNNKELCTRCFYALYPRMVCAGGVQHIESL